LNQFNYASASTEINKLVKEANIDQFNPNYTSREYVVAVRRYLRNNLINKYLDDMKQLFYKSYSIEQMLLSCSFQNKKCYMDEFMYYYDFTYGLCFRFNVGKSANGKDLPIKKSGQVGHRNGLQLELYAGHAKFQDEYSIKRGFRVLVFNRSVLYPVADEIGIDLATGQETSIGIRRIFINHLPAPFSNCLPADTTKIDWTQNEVLKYMHDNFIKGQYYWSTDAWDYAGNWTWDWRVAYSQSKCVKLCSQMYLFQECGKYYCLL
jgi:hypothetical protein